MTLSQLLYKLQTYDKVSPLTIQHALDFISTYTDEDTLPALVYQNNQKIIFIWFGQSTDLYDKNLVTLYKFRLTFTSDDKVRLRRAHYDSDYAIDHILSLNSSKDIDLIKFRINTAVQDK